MGVDRMITFEEKFKGLPDWWIEKLQEKEKVLNSYKGGRYFQTDTLCTFCGSELDMVMGRKVCPNRKCL
jgi:hypothetical protein